jgi:uncharacterized protein
MIKYLLLGLLAIWLYYALRRSLSGRAKTPPETASPPKPQSMVECAHCGVHMPANDALIGHPSADEPGYYCNEDHRRAGPRAH